MKRLFYIQDARCLKVKLRERAFKQFKSPVLNVLISVRVTFHVVLLCGAGCTAEVGSSRKFESVKKILKVSAKFEYLFMHIFYKV